MTSNIQVTSNSNVTATGDIHIHHEHISNTQHNRFKIFENISAISKWSSIDKANEHREAIHPLWIAPVVIIEIVIITWFQKSFESAINTISILKEELEKVQAQLQKIKFQVKI